MVLTESALFNRINTDEKNYYEKNGNIRMHNSVLRYNEIFYSEKILAETDDAFYSRLKKTVFDNELSKNPMIPSIVMLVIELIFILCCVSVHLKPIHLLMFIAVPAVMFIFSAASVIKEGVKLCRALSCIKQKRNIYGVSFEIDGKCIYSDERGDENEEQYYLTSGPVMICVPERIYNSSKKGSNLIGAVVGAGKYRRFYAVYVK